MSGTDAPAGPRTLLLDIETAPSMAYIWGLWQETRSTDFIEADWYILCWCAKWLGEDDIITASLPDHELYGLEPRNDARIMARMHELLDEADIVIGHNARKFDVKKINARMLIHKMSPPSPYRIVDTLMMARNHFAFTSNKLDDLGRALDLGQKHQTGGFQLWRDVMDGKAEAWDRMTSYCAQDVRLLERVYRRLRAWSTRLPNHGAWTGEVCCVKCGSRNLIRKGYARTAVSTFQRFRCKDCGGWTRGSARVGQTAPMRGVV